MFIFFTAATVASLRRSRVTETVGVRIKHERGTVDRAGCEYLVSTANSKFYSVAPIEGSC